MPTFVTIQLVSRIELSTLTMLQTDASKNTEKEMCVRYLIHMEHYEYEIPETIHIPDYTTCNPGKNCGDKDWPASPIDKYNKKPYVSGIAPCSS